jgi:integrase
VRLHHLNASGHWPSGNPRLYYRPKGAKAVPLPDLPQDHPDFLAAYAAARTADLGKVAPAKTGTIAAGIAAFIASDSYLARSASTRAVWRRTLDDIARRYGAGRVADLAERHLRADLAPLRPHPANNRLKTWRALCGWWAEAGLAAANAAKGIKRRKTPRTDGHLPWTAADVERFRDRWPVGSAERLALELLHWTGARIGDTVRLSETMVAPDGWLAYRQGKTGGAVIVPLSAPAPIFAEPEGRAHLLACLAARQQRHIVFLTTVHGAPRSVKAASQWFSAAARVAGIKGKSAHGLRKRRLSMMAENGATEAQLMAWCGHLSPTEVQVYTRAASRKRMLSRTPEERRVPTQVPTGQIAIEN